MMRVSLCQGILILYEGILVSGYPDFTTMKVSPFQIIWVTDRWVRGDWLAMAEPGWEIGQHLRAPERSYERF